jgi:hypothetical protein
MMSHWGWHLTHSEPSRGDEALSVKRQHPPGWRGRLLCTVGLHSWHVGRYVVFCCRCYTTQ